jgi:sulfite reductase (NADPH) flavoprotein alpha-component
MKQENELQIKMPEPEPTTDNHHHSLHVIYGSRTGNSMSAARLASDYAAHLGIKSYLQDMKTIEHSQIGLMKNILIAVSTHGEGDPPAVVEKFYDFIHSDDAPSMKGTHFSVLALGDSSYKDFCKTGHDFRKRLLELGGIEISPLAECDIDYEDKAMIWVRQAVNAFEGILPKTGIRNDNEFAFEINKIETDDDKVFYANVKEIKMLTNPGFRKRTFHLVLSMEKFGTPFYPGDSFGIYAHNSRFLVDKLLTTLQFDGTHAVRVEKTDKLLKDALINDFEITVITPVVVEKYAELTQSGKLLEFISERSDLELYCETCDVLDLVTDFPSEISPEAFIRVLRKLNPRLYSVANCPLVYPNEAHFTLGLMEYPIKNRHHTGVCSAFFSDRVETGDSIPVYLEANENFRKTEDDSKPLIMIATGTGIAPFRGFLQHREHQKSTGDNWLFFGDRHAESDFLYKDEIQDYLKKGVLTRLNTAFSRDQREKIYVQHLLLENSKEIFQWIHQREAEVYICGNKRTMGKDVKETLGKIVATEGKLTQSEAEEYLQNLRSNKRLKTDLY